LKCYAYEKDDDFIFCVEDAKAENEDIILHAWFTKNENGYEKVYPMENGADKTWFKNEEAQMMFMGKVL
jgi:hypothetical protein